MFSADFISGSRNFTQHLISGELILIQSANACILLQIARACGEKPFLASLKLTSDLSYLSSIYLRNMKAGFVRIDRKIEIAENTKSSPKKVDLWANSGKVQHTDFQSLCACSESSLTNPIGEQRRAQMTSPKLRPPT